MKVEFEPSKVIFSTLPGKLHIVAEMVSKVQREKEFWMLFGIVSEEQKLCSPIQGKRELYYLKGRGSRSSLLWLSHVEFEHIVEARLTTQKSWF